MLENEIKKIRKRYSQKVDSLNWQSLSYQKKANEKFNEDIKQLIRNELGSVVPEKRSKPDANASNYALGIHQGFRECLDQIQSNIAKRGL